MVFKEIFRIFVLTKKHKTHNNTLKNKIKQKMTSTQKRNIWNLIEKYDSYIKKGFTEYVEFVGSLSKVLQEEASDKDYLIICKNMDWESIGEKDFRILESTFGAKIDEVLFTDDYEMCK